MDDGIITSDSGSRPMEEVEKLPVAEDEVLWDIGSLASRCRALLYELTSQDGSQTEAKTQLIAFNIWIAAVGAFRKGKQSLGYRLKSLPETSTQIQKLLSSLEILLRKQLAAPNVGQDADFSGSESDASSEYSATSVRFATYSDDDSDAELQQNSLWMSIQDTIASLRQLALKLRSAGASHRQERVQRFIKLPRNQQQYNMFRLLATQTVEHAEAFEKAPAWLHERLAESIALRRARILYLKEHKIKTQVIEEPQHTIQKQAATTTVSVPDATVATEDPGQAPKPPTISQPLTIAPSINQRSQMSMTVATKLEPPKKAPSVASIQISTSTFPPMPFIDLKTDSFICPFCSLEYPATDFESRTAWHNHLTHDLEPFFCINEECSTPFECGSSYSSWLAHMKKTHTQPRWQCWYCPQPSSKPLEFASSSLFEDHLSAEHSDKIEASLRGTVAKHSIIQDGLSLLSCPFCGGYPEELEAQHSDQESPEAIEALFKHIRNHLISAALILLPRDFDSGNTRGNKTLDSDAGEGNASAHDFEDLALLEGLVTDEQLRCENEDCECRIPSSIVNGDWSSANLYDEYSSAHTLSDAIKHALDSTSPSQEIGEWDFCRLFSLRPDYEPISTSYPPLEDDEKLYEYFQLGPAPAGEKTSTPEPALPKPYESWPELKEFFSEHFILIFDIVFTELCGTKEKLTRKRFRAFLHDVQGMDTIPDMDQECYDFVQFMMFLWHNRVWHKSKDAPAMDLSRPITNYFINSSGDLLAHMDFYTPKNPLEYHTDILHRGCRSIEFHVWDGIPFRSARSPSIQSLSPRASQSPERKPNNPSRLSVRPLAAASRAISSLFNRSSSKPETSPAQLQLQLPSTTDGDGYLWSDASNPRSSDIIEPIVKHQDSLLSHYPFRQVCASILHKAFATSSLPILVTLKVHACRDQQKVMLNIMKEIWGGYLVDSPIEGYDPRFRVPRLEDVQRRIFVRIQLHRARVTVQDTASPVDDDEYSLPPIDQEEYTLPLMPAQTNRDLYPPLAALTIYTRKQQYCGYKSLNTKDPKHPAHIFSIPEGSVINAHKHDERGLFLHNKSFFMQTYPFSLRVDASNMNPVRFWSEGVQMVAMNWHQIDEGMMLNHAMFAGTEGWVLKPPGYQSSDKQSETAKEAMLLQEMDLDVVVYFGSNVAPVAMIDPDKVLHCAVQVQLHVDRKRIAARTSRYTDQTPVALTKDPSWVENGAALKFYDMFGVAQPFSFIRFLVKDTESMLDYTLSWACIRLDRLTQGFQYIPLYDNRGLSILDGKLFVYIDKRMK